MGPGLRVPGFFQVRGRTHSLVLALLTGYMSVILEVLKQVWNLSDQDGDSMLSTCEFCTAFYFMELFSEGQTLPATLPSGIHLDDWNLLGVPDGPKTGPKLPTNYGGTGRQQMQDSFHLVLS